MISRGRLTALVVLGSAGLFAVLIGMVRPEQPPSVDRIELRSERSIDLVRPSPVGAVGRRSQPAVGATRRSEGRSRGSALDLRSGGDHDTGFGDDDGGTGEQEGNRNRSGGGSRRSTAETAIAGGGDDKAGDDDASTSGEDDSGDDGSDD